MKKIAILGASGMLGSMVYNFFRNFTDYKLLVTVRDNFYDEFVKNSLNALPSEDKVICKKLDAETITVEEIESIISEVQWVINCTGVIKPYIEDDDLAQVRRAIVVNSRFPYNLAEATGNLTGVRVIQIATDCVFSGDQGNYVETDLHNSDDIYGKSKSVGEVKADIFHNLRCSIIGPEKKGHKSFLDWVLSQKQNAALNGFTNHKWNGVTTLHFAKICKAIIENDINLPNIQHIIAGDIVNKYQMVNSFKDNFNREDLKINKFKTPQAVIRTLFTNNQELNDLLWMHAGYKKSPTVQKMVEELAEYNKLYYKLS